MTCNVLLTVYDYRKATFDDNDKNHAFHNPTISPDEELSRRGYSMYVAEDAESGRGTTERYEPVFIT